MRNNLINIAGLENIKFISSNKITSKILGNSILSNMFNVGVAYQSGRAISASSIEKAIELNGASVNDNIDAFRFGRHYENLKEEVINIIKDEPEILEGFDAKYQNRFKFLEDYQNKKYAQNYEDLVSYAKKVDKEVGNGSQFSTAVLKNYFKLMAYKDEYEVSRLMTNKKFSDDINKNFEGNFSYNFYLAPPIFSKKSK